jgi:hypothetical protein
MTAPPRRQGGNEEPRPGHGHAPGRWRALHAVPDARPVPEPRKPSAPRTSGKTARQLTDEEIFSLVRRDPDNFLEEDFWRDVVLFDRAIDHEPETEEPEMEL